MTWFRTNQTVTNAPANYLEGYILRINNNITIVAHNMENLVTYKNQKGANTTFLGWDEYASKSDLVKTVDKTYTGLSTQSDSGGNNYLVIPYESNIPRSSILGILVMGNSGGIGDITYTVLTNSGILLKCVGHSTNGTLVIRYTYR